MSTSVPYFIEKIGGYWKLQRRNRAIALYVVDKRYCHRVT